MLWKTFFAAYSLKGAYCMRFTKKVTALCLALLTCLTVLLPCAVFAEACVNHVFDQGTVTPATMTEDGKIEYACSVCGEIETEIIPRIGSVSLYASSATFKDKAQRPTVIVKDINGDDIGVENYVVSLATAYGAEVSYCKQIGAYTVTVTFIGKYSGSADLTFKIVPVAVENLHVTSSAAKSVTFTFDKVDGAKGYQIYYSTHRYGPYKRLATTSQTTYTYNKLKSGTVYYFKVRAYKGTRTGIIGGKFSGVRRCTVH